jgi:hypothetical protein
MSVDTDAYEVNPRDYEELAFRMDNRGFNGSTRVMTTLLALMNLLASAAIIGGVIMYGEVKALDVKVENLDNKVELIIMGHIK